MAELGITVAGPVSSLVPGYFEHLVPAHLVVRAVSAMGIRVEGRADTVSLHVTPLSCFKACNLVL